MKFFQDISDFSNLEHYLPILNGCINTDMFALFLLDFSIIHSKYLDIWYEKYNLNASIVNICVLFLVIIVTRFLYKYIFSDFTILKFVGIAIVIQFIHDICFYFIIFNLKNKFVVFFKRYAKDSGYRLLLGNALMITVAVLGSSTFATMSTNMNVICLVLSMYILPFLIHGKKKSSLQ
jgi:hypothetical protein